MGCCGDREKQEDLRKEQRWEYINLDDFKSTSCLAPFAYGWLWIMLAVSVSVYAVDTFTAINLIAFDKWSGQIKPAIPFTIARWIFAGCIILSFVLLIYRWVRAVRVMRRGGVAKSYLDPLAVRIQSIRMGRNGRGWKRFLVFAELTKSRKGADYVALFAHYSFEAWLRIIFAEGPRQVINAITLFSVMKAKLIPEGDHAATADTSPFIQFWKNVGILADQDKLQAVILFGMLWTLIIWVISAISLAVSVLLYLIFLWHHIPPNAGGLSKYCRTKINRRLERVVRVKVDKALKHENELMSREEARAAREGNPIKKQPTLPNVTPFGEPMPGLSRQTTLTTLPEYESRPASLRNSNEALPSMPASFIDGRPLPRRNMTQASDASWASYNSTAPLMQQAAEPGQLPRDHMATPGSVAPGPWPARPMPNRSATGFSQYSEQSITPISRPLTANSMRNGPGPGAFQMEPLPRPGTAMSSASRGRNPSAEQGNFSSMSNVALPTSGAPYPSEGAGSYFPAVSDHGSHSSNFGPPGRAQTFQDNLPRAYTPHQTPVDRSQASSAPPPMRSLTPASSVSGRSFAPDYSQPDRSMNHSVPPPSRSYTPGGVPPGRSTSSAGPSHPSSWSQSGPTFREPTLPAITMPARTTTPARTGEYQAFSSAAKPSTLTRTETSSTVASGGYTAFNPRLATSTPAPGGTSSTSAEPITGPPQTVRSFSRPLGPGQHNDAQRDSDVSDILDSY